jgi:endoglycosylceramidase
LAQFQQQWIRMRDELHPRAMLLFEPLPLVPFGFPSRMPTPTADHIVYAPHLYDATAMGLGRYVRWASTFEPSLRRVLATAQRLNVPLFVGEFGVLGGVDDAEALIEDQCRLFDRHFVSWTAWHYSPGVDDWNDEDASIVGSDGSDRPWTAALVRPYPRALGGVPRTWDSPQVGPWTLKYAPAGTTFTEIVVPSRWAGVGLEVEVDGATHGWERGVLMIEPSAAPEVTVRLHRG